MDRISLPETPKRFNTPSTEAGIRYQEKPKTNVSSTTENAVSTAKNAALIARNAALIARNAALTANNAVLAAQNAVLAAQNAEISFKDARSIAENAALTAENAALTAENAASTAENTASTVENAISTTENTASTTEATTSPTKNKDQVNPMDHSMSINKVESFAERKGRVLAKDGYLNEVVLAKMTSLGEITPEDVETKLQRLRPKPPRPYTFQSFREYYFPGYGDRKRRY